MLCPKSWREVGSSASFKQRRNEHFGVEQVDAHRGRNQAGVIGRAQIGLLRLLLEADNLAGVIDVNHAKQPGFRRINQDGRDGDIRARVLVLPQHADVVHLVDVVARQDEHILWLLGADRVNVLVHRVGGAHVPVLADALHRGHDLDELSQFAAHDVAPALADVTVQRQRFVLRQDINPAEIGVNAIGQGNVDDAVDSAKRDGWFGAVTGQRIETLARSSSQQDSEGISHPGNFPSGNFPGRGL